VEEEKVSDLTLKVEVSPGCKIEEAASQLVALSHRLNCDLDFQFNDFNCICTPEMTGEDVVQQYHKALWRKEDVKA
jgi:hypothetical protein